MSLKLKLLTGLVCSAIISTGLWLFGLDFLIVMLILSAVLCFSAFLLVWMDEGNEGMYP